MPRDRRRLTAIVSADVVGYSSLMGRDESGTLAALKSHLQELIDPKIAEYCGRTVKSMGDGLLLEFPSVVDAVRCAVDVQRGMLERNTSVPPDRQIQFRVGINVGDIIIDGADIYGDGVNIASRLQTLAEPGGICVSRGVRDQVLDKLSFTFQDLGAREVKNISRAVEVFRVDLFDSTSPHKSVSRSGLRRLPSATRWPWVAVGVAVLAIAGVGVSALHPILDRGSSATPRALSVAVLPFVVTEDNLSDAHRADVLRGELINRIAMYDPSMSVLRIDVPDADRNPTEVGRRYRVRYVVTGALQRDETRGSLQIGVVEAESGAQLLGQRQVLQDSPADALPSAMTRKFLSSVPRTVYDAEIRRVANEPVKRLGAVELALRGDHTLGQPGSASTSEARRFYDAALQKDPNLVAALIGKSTVLDSELDVNPGRDRDQMAHEMDELTAKALLLDSTRASVWTSRSVALAAGGQLSAALEAIDGAIQRDPYNPHLYTYKAQWMVLTGRPAEALRLVEQSMALDPDYTGWAMMVGCQAHLFLGQAEQAIAKCERAASFEPNRTLQLFLAAAYGNQGTLDKATAARQLVLQKMPVSSIEELRAMRYSNDPAYLKLAEAYLYPGLVRAGMPER